MIVEARPRGATPGHVTAIVTLSDGIDRVVRLLLCFIGGGMALLIGVQVFSRYVLNTSIFWAEEVGRMCLVWITFLGATAAYRRHQHVGVDMLVRRMPRRIRVASGLTAWSVSMALFGVMLFHGMRFLGFVAHQKTAALGLSMVIPYVVIPASGVVFLLHGLRHLLEQVYGSRGE
jgi:TRAP-type transport system small permease protein